MPAYAQALGLTHTSIGKKLLMAVTGSILVLFVIGHMVGNLQFYLGPQAINSYAQALRRFPPLLWTVRVVLLFCASVHVIAALLTTVQSWRSRGRYRVPQRFQAATWSSRTMRWSGLALLGFVLYHLAHLTWGTAHSEFVEGAVYDNMITGFMNPVASAIYIATMLLLGTHMLHGIWSLFQTLGVNSSRWTDRLRLLALGITGAVVLGNISIPVSVLAGWVG